MEEGEGDFRFLAHVVFDIQKLETEEMGELVALELVPAVEVEQEVCCIMQERHYPALLEAQEESRPLLVQLVDQVDRLLSTLGSKILEAKVVMDQLLGVG